MFHGETEGKESANKQSTTQTYKSEHMQSFQREPKVLLSEFIAEPCKLHFSCI